MKHRGRREKQEDKLWECASKSQMNSSVYGHTSPWGHKAKMQIISDVFICFKQSHAILNKNILHITCIFMKPC